MKRRKPGRPRPKPGPAPAPVPTAEELALGRTHAKLRRLLFQELAREAAPIAWEWHHEYPDYTPELLKSRTWND